MEPGPESLVLVTVIVLARAVGPEKMESANKAAPNAPDPKRTRGCFKITRRLLFEAAPKARGTHGRTAAVLAGKERRLAGR
jgi:hypothetical protein